MLHSSPNISPEYLYLKTAPNYMMVVCSFFPTSSPACLVYHNQVRLRFWEDKKTNKVPSQYLEQEVENPFGLRILVSHCWYLFEITDLEPPLYTPTFNLIISLGSVAPFY